MTRMLLNRLQCDHLSCFLFCFLIYLFHVLFLISKGNHYSRWTAVSTIKELDKCSNPVLFGRFLNCPYSQQWHHNLTVYIRVDVTKDSFVCLFVFLIWIRHQIMMKCWEENPNDRRTFEKLRKTMKDMERNHKVKRINLKKDYVYFRDNSIIQLFFVYHEL